MLDLGPAHPSGHGVLRLHLVVADGDDGPVVVSADPVVGHLHRGAEKLFEVRDYRQGVMLANRHDWLSAVGSELALVLAAERSLGLEVPPRATWARLALAELNRAAHHLAFLSATPPGLGPRTDVAPVRAAREGLLQAQEEATGGRVHPAASRVGGLAQDVPDGWPDRARRAAERARAVLEVLAALTVDDDALAARTRGVGVLDAATAAAHGVTGPVARAAGLDVDVRRDDPYLAYEALADVLRVVLRPEGDAHARLFCLLEETAVALDLAVAALDRLSALGTGPVAVRLPKVLRLPEGHVYVWTENPGGANGCYLVSRGGTTPWRLKVRAASFGTVQSLSAVLPGTRLADLTAVLASLFYVVGDVDR